MKARRLFADALRYTERARQSTRSAAMVARAAMVECESHLGEHQVRRAQKALAEAVDSAWHGLDPFLLEQIRALRTSFFGVEEAR